MLADSRLVGYANQTLRPPPDFYGPLLFSCFDGVDTTLSHTLADGLLRGKLFVGRSPETSPFVESYTYRLKGSSMYGGHVDYFSGDWQLRAGHSHVVFANEQPVNAYVGVDVLAAVPELSMQDKGAGFDSLGFVYDRGAPQVHAMLSRIHQQSSFYENSHSAFVVAAYRLQNLSPYLGYSRVKSTAKSITPSGDHFTDLTAAALAASSHADQHTLTLGARWDFLPNFALKL